VAITTFDVVKLETTLAVKHRISDRDLVEGRAGIVDTDIQGLIAIRTNDFGRWMRDKGM
jgi:hypothetical protein